MLDQLTLRNRVFVITSLLILMAFALVFTIVRPRYKEAILKERTTVISQLQEYTLRSTDENIRDWLNAINTLAEEISANPQLTQSVSGRAINFTPGLVRITITEQSTGEMVDFVRTIYENALIPDKPDVWYDSRLDPRISVGWEPGKNGEPDVLIAQRTIQLLTRSENGSFDDSIFLLRMYFDASSLIDELLNIPLSGDPDQNRALIATTDGFVITDSLNFEIPGELIGDASFSTEVFVKQNGRDWYVLSSDFQTIPFWHVIAVDEQLVLQPVRNLILFSLATGAATLLFMLAFSWYVSIRINKPIEQLIGDVEAMSELDFSQRIRPVALPEFRLMRETLDDIRETLLRYQKLNVEKIILEEWKNRYMMTYSEDLIGILDNDGTFRFINNHFIEFIEGLGYNPNEVLFEELIGDKRLEITKSSQTVHYPSPYSIRIKSGDLVQKTDTGNSYYYDYQHVTFHDEEDKPQGALIILHDKTTDRLNDIQRNDMINIIVHELKNPISGVVGISKLMLDYEDLSKEEYTRFLSEMYRTGLRMNDLVNRFLDVQKLEHGKVSMDFSDVDLFRILNDAKSISTTQLKEKSIRMNISAKGTSFIVSGNRELIFDAVQNLISNAIKYGEKDRTIEAELRRTEHQTLLSITDFGYGISIEDQKKVFEKFFRVKSNINSAKEKGTGLGLAYVKEIMIKHKGDVQLESNEKIGSSFTLIFPDKKGEED